MVVGRKRKRYVLFACSGQLNSELRKELTRLVLHRHPDLEKLVWLDGGLIAKTDTTHLVEIKGGPPFRTGKVELSAKSASGSISKLKRMASDSER